MTEKITIGTVGYPIKKNKMLHDVDVVELTESRHIPPGKKAARHIRDELPAALDCTVQISRYFVSTPPQGATLKGDIANYGQFQITDESMSLWKRQVEFAGALNARALVLVTPSSITPSGANVKAMAEFFDAVDRGGLPIVWEAHGPWESSQVHQFAAAHQLIPAVDPLRDAVPEGSLAYFRFGAFAATGSRMGVYELEQIVAAALDSSADEVFCLFETHRALDDARNLKKVLAEFGSDDFGDFEYDFDDGDDEDEEFV
ncbi:MAG: hypothetical protein JXX29_12720 [Deltaproteobacteria bacterium]|nr:hypothetical protein [Deltaproteobacteria bacterium]MBN2672539.1 hypothetical protein [Deltaproteobacteria bacterium]